MDKQDFNFNNVKYSASVMCLDLGNLKEEFRTLQRININELHFDMMDGRFVPNLTLGFDFISLAKKCCSLPCWAHLMIEKPERYLKRLVEKGCSGITVHVEACIHPHRVVKHIRDLGLLAGIAINPMTPLDELEYLLPEVDRVLVMTVDPGYAGQKLIPQSFERVQILARKIKYHQYSVDIEVDGNITVRNGAKFIRLGANILILGSSSIFHGLARNYEETFPHFCQEIEKLAHLV
ncbi:MAG TPA: ribulose-phosphate 3-epimerase [Candidatus Hydrogenedens sp.]|nr:ribulose-phosphate 3-epimerase [Candidatus Hydrogenedens sp.]HOK09539.1 ribulose-phosphate 3-epimerase [Candidatus Hydrogenedens sp.]HOL19186.1 ribulose-phosphate 3-epimerase [Candidatus Hydrogenedens sp.]HPP58402.1 ribulose-phosphate 3-epimerase [Candidatus Hydrogenedens sp.]